MASGHGPLEDLKRRDEVLLIPMDPKQCGCTHGQEMPVDGGQLWPIVIGQKALGLTLLGNEVTQLEPFERLWLLPEQVLKINRILDPVARVDFSKVDQDRWPGRRRLCVSARWPGADPRNTIDR